MRGGGKDGLVPSLERLGTVLFRELTSKVITHESDVQIRWRGQTQRALQQDLPGRGRGKIFSAHDMVHALRRIVDHHGELVSPQAIRPLEHEIACHSVNLVDLLP